VIEDSLLVRAAGRMILSRPKATLNGDGRHRESSRQNRRDANADQQFGQAESPVLSKRTSHRATPFCAVMKQVSTTRGTPFVPAHVCLTVTLSIGEFKRAAFNEGTVTVPAAERATTMEVVGITGRG